MARPRDSLSKYLDQRINELRRLAPRAASSASPETVHQARVTTRRLKAALDLLEPALPAGPRKATARVLRRLCRALGPLRDDDVMRERLRELRDDAGTSAIVRRLERHLKDERHRPKRFTRGQATKAVAKLSRAWETILDRSDDLAERGRTLFRRALARQLSDFGRAAARSVEARAGEAGAIADVHQLRITGKALRYTLELADRLGMRLPQRVLRVLKNLQDALGSWHDEVVLGERALQLALDERLPSGDPLSYRQALRFAGACERRGRRHLDGFVRVWSRNGDLISAMPPDLRYSPGKPKAGPPTNGQGMRRRRREPAREDTATAAIGEPEPRPAGPAPSPAA